MATQSPGALAELSERYRIERELGAGGMATVYLAHDVRHERKVALKVLRPELAAMIGADRFLQEIRTTANLQHPHILPLFDSGQASGPDGTLLFYVMPFVEGESLRDRLTRERQLPVAGALRIATEVASALDYAHRHGVIHRDIKPENILLHDGQALVADFGIALAVSTAGGSRMTETGLSLGTPHYMSPEQATGERDISAATDVYALGCVLFEMLAGEPPFTGPSAQAVVAKVLTTDPTRVTVFRKTVAPYVAAAVQTALQKLPADRFRSAAEFAAALAGRSGTAADVAIPTAPAPALPWRARMPWILAAAGVAVAAAAVLWSLDRPGAASPAVMAHLLPPEGHDFSEQSDFGQLSPDGTRFAFVARDRQGTGRLWVRRLDALSAEPVPGTENAKAPFWSPNGRHIAYLARGRLWRVPQEGGPPGPLCEVPNALNGAWVGEDEILLATPEGILRGPARQGSCHLAIPTRTGPRPLTLTSHPNLLPGGSHVLFAGRDPALGFYSLYVGDLRTGEWHALQSNATDPTLITGDLVVYGSLSGGAARLVAQGFNARHRRLEGEPVVLSGGVRRAANLVSYSAVAGALVYLPSAGDGVKLLVDRRGDLVDTVRIQGAWTHRFSRSGALLALGGTLSAGGASQLVLVDFARGLPATLANLSTYPVWSPGDSLIAVTTGLGTGLRLIRVEDGRDSLLVAGGARGLIPTDWTGDGRYLLGTRLPTDTVAHSDLVAWDFAAKELIPVLSRAGNLTEAVVSPDGRWLAYRSDETGAAEVFVRPFLRSGLQVRVSTAGGRLPRWRRDARELYYQTPDGEIVAAGFSGDGAPRILQTRILFQARAWGRALFFDNGHSYDASPDGDRFVLRTTASAHAAVIDQSWRRRLTAPLP